jgi:protein-L-isoaspartate O-methyltransferase
VIPASAGGLNELIDLLDPQPDERILDAGCGIGLAAARLAALGARVTAVDRDAAAIEQARHIAPAAERIVADLMEWWPPEPFDAILARGLLDWLSPREAAPRLAAFLKPGGRLAADLGASRTGLALLAQTAGALGGDAPMPPAPAEWEEALEAAGLRIIARSAASDRTLILARKI